MNRLAAVLTVALISQPALAQSYVPENIAIINAASQRAIEDPVGPNDRAAPGGWTPTADDAQAAYKALGAALTDPELRTPAFHDRQAQAALAGRLSQYRLQIRGTTTPAGAEPSVNGQPGDRMIHIFGICPEEDVKNWRSGAIIADGGSCFFNALYDLRRAKILYFGFNGVA